MTMTSKLPLALLVTLAAIPLSVQAEVKLAKYRDKNRVLLVFAPSSRDPRWQRQNAMLAGSKAQFTDRDLLRFDDFEAGRQADSALRSRYHVEPGQFRVLLIGKDGHVAVTGRVPLALHFLTGAIDRMPMRRDEMRRKGEIK